MRNNATHMTAVCLAALITLSAVSAGAVTVGDDLELDTRKRAAVVDSIAAKLIANCVMEEEARAMAEHLKEQLGSGAYDGIDDLHTFVRRLDADARSVHDDPHFGIRVLEEPVTDDTAAEESEALHRQMYVEHMRFTNFGFDRVERLEGNIGYLKVSIFSYEHLGGHTAHAAMAFLSYCDVLIIDLRRCYGGRREVMEILMSYLFEEAQHYATEINKVKRKTEEHWTREYVPGRKMTDVPVYVLTGWETASGAEQMAFTLLNRERAVIVGDTTAGAAHGTYRAPIPSVRTVVFCPHELVSDPLTGTDWEGVGIIPDVTVPEKDALLYAHVDALTRLIAKEENEMRAFGMEWALRELKAQLEPTVLTGDELEAFTGSYGARHVRAEDGKLIYQREGRTSYELVPLGDDLFKFRGDDLYYFRIEFERDNSGDVTALVGWYDDGTRDVTLRTE